jgi:hypothetical protein
MANQKVKHTEPVVVFIDRIEDGIAIITLGDDDNIHFDLPLKYLPADVSEGDHFTLTFQPDPEQTEAVGQRVTELQEELSGQDDQTNIRL